MKDNLASKKTLDLFHQAAKEVPAYRDFLQKGGVQSDEIKIFRSMFR